MKRQVFTAENDPVGFHAMMSQIESFMDGDGDLSDEDRAAFRQLFSYPVTPERMREWANSVGRKENA